MRKRRFLFMARLGLLLCATIIAVGCSSDDYTPPPNACGALQDVFVSGVGTANGTKVTSATLVAAKDAAAGVEYCKVVGVIYPITTSETVTAGGVTTVVPTENITFNVALPTKWNLKAIQVGGGGFNGSVPAVDTASANGIQSPLARGYAVLASDSGHTQAKMPQTIWNTEALKNFGREQLKKTHDAAFYIIKTYYAATPTRSYFQGNSQGGGEALDCAQFYPADYDGVIAGYPAYNLQAMHPGSMDTAKALYNAHTAGVDGYKYTCPAGGGWISRAQMKAVSEAIIAVCDTLDGAADGVVSNPGAATCQVYRDSLYLHTADNPLRCAGGSHTAALGTAAYDNEACLSDPQIDTIARITSRYNFAPGITLRGGLKSYGKWPQLDGVVLDLAKDPGQEDFGSAYNVIDAFQATFPSQDQVNIITRDASWTRQTIVTSFDISKWVARVIELDSWMGAGSVNYDAFEAKHGKIIHFVGSSDVSITPYNSIDLYLRLSGQFVGNTQYLGTNAFWGTSDAATNATARQEDGAAISNGIVNGFYTFYLIPGYGHGKGYYKAAVDWLTALENWVEKDVAPGNSLTSLDTQTAHASLGTRPVCYFPYYPKYTGAVGGDTKLASNYTCAKLDAYSNLK
jgi:hypothetical protein